MKTDEKYAKATVMWVRIIGALEHTCVARRLFGLGVKGVDNKGQRGEYDGLRKAQEEAESHEAGPVTTGSVE